ncbi:MULTISPECIES: sensor domain-containing phosphodiesterase [Methylotenera]|uniref:sensor domain-containing phosphodiesterase n=1 Tax=Methylotenera TaxID=359407 RepID=UPI0003678728|nr:MULTISPECIES: EAL domain-containing protein [Methylotenera]
MNQVATQNVYSDNKLNRETLGIEIARLKALRRYHILDTPSDGVLDKITEIAAHLLNFPIALINMVDDERIWSKSHYGTHVKEYQLHSELCASVVLQDTPYIIYDAKTDPRTKEHPLVNSATGIEFYAGVQLKTHDHHNIGSLCVIDYQPRSISNDQIKMLQDLAVLAMEHIELLIKQKDHQEILEIETRFRLTELQNQLILDSAAEGIHVINLEGTIVVENAAASRLLGWPEGGLLGKNAHITMHHHHADELFYPKSECPILQTLVDGLPRQVSTEVFWRKDGTFFPVDYSTNPLIDLDGKLCGVTVVFRDITDRKLNEAKIQRLAYFDPLTDLPNRTLFIDRLGQEIKKAHRDHVRVALMFIDLDHFKEINDSLGHDVGDLLLIEAAQRLVSCVRNSDTVARLGGDEFTVILSDIAQKGSEEIVAQNILNVLTQPFKIKKETIYLSSSIGITIYPDNALTTDELLKNADQAMYAAKKAGRNRYHYFQAEMQIESQTRLHLITDLHNAVDNKEFFLVYQPIIELATGHVKKAEALIRWQHPVKGMVSPAQFIPVAEKTGLIVRLGQWVFEEAVKQVKTLESFGIEDFQISINKSPVQFTEFKGTHQHWFEHLSQNGLTGENICIEITEGLLLDATNEVTDKLVAFMNAGMQVALDDFGTGYSSLAYLKKFSIDYIKIDQSFVKNLNADADDYALCEAMIVMAHKLNIKVIAEGVETKLQHDLLLKAGCDYAQGYYLSKPMNVKDFHQYLLSKQS